MTILGSYLNSLKKTFNWKERANRKEFWIFHFVSFVIQLTFVIVISSQLPKQITSQPELSQVIVINLLLLSFLLYLLGTFFTTISLGIRRLNDLEKSKLWIFLLMVPFVGLVFYFIYLGFSKGKVKIILNFKVKMEEPSDNTFIEVK